MNICLIGPMGSGKTTLGRALSSHLNLQHIDTDEEISRRYHASISDIFSQRGEEGFRALESQLLKESLLLPNTIVSTGGGAVLSSGNRERLAAHPFVIYLFANPHCLFSRIGNINSRPLLQQAPDPLAKLQELMIERHPWYLEVANDVIDTSERTIHDVIRIILREVIENDIQA